MTLEVPEDPSLERIHDDGLVTVFKEPIPFLRLDIVHFHDALILESWVLVSW